MPKGEMIYHDEKISICGDFLFSIQFKDKRSILPPQMI